MWHRITFGLAVCTTGTFIAAAWTSGPLREHLTSTGAVLLVASMAAVFAAIDREL